MKSRFIPGEKGIRSPRLTTDLYQRQNTKIYEVPGCTHHYLHRLTLFSGPVKDKLLELKIVEVCNPKVHTKGSIFKVTNFFLSFDS